MNSLEGETEDTVKADSCVVLSFTVPLLDRNRLLSLTSADGGSGVDTVAG